VGPASPEPSRPRTVRVTVVDEQDIPVDAARLAALAQHVLTALEVPGELELAVTCVTVEAMTALNTEHMGSMGPTDVLAFPIDAPADVTPGVPGLLGDVVLCPAIAHSQAVDHDRGPTDEIELLLVHGILHLLGHDHAGADERRVMFSLTDDLLRAFGTAPGAVR
jgi:probable rRNA maturation factor